MPIIKDPKEIDWAKFDKSFSLRGTPLLNPNFYQYLHRAFFTPDAKLEVHQCQCGQIFIIQSGAVKSVDSELFCKFCDSSIYREYKLHDFKPSEELLKLLDMIDNFAEEESTQSWMDLLKQYGKAFPNTLKPRTFSELLLLVQNANTDLSHENSSKSYLENELDKLLQAAFSNQKKNELFSCIKPRPEEILMFTQVRLDILREWEEQARSELRNTYEHTALRRNRSHENFQRLIRLELFAYQHAVESEHAIIVLGNLCKMAMGKPPSSMPFSREAKSSLAKRLNELYDMIQSSPIKDALKKGWNTKIRNAIAHNDYFINYNTQKISFGGQNGEQIQLSPTEIRDMIATVFSLKDAVENIYIHEYNLLAGHVRNVVLGYSNPIVQDNTLSPKNIDTLPNLTIFGYFFDSDFIPNLRLELLENDLRVAILDWDETLNIDAEIRKWLAQLIISDGRVEIDLVSIDPSHPKAYIRPDGNEIPSPSEAVEKIATHEITISQSALKKIQDLFQI